MKSAFVWRVPCFDCLSRILHFPSRLLFLSWSVGQNAALSKSELLYGCMAFDVGRYGCLHILHPHRKESTSRSCRLFSLMTLLTVNFISTFCTQFQLLCTQFQLSVLFWIKWRALSQWACWNFLHVYYKRKRISVDRALIEMSQNITLTFASACHCAFNMGVLK